MLVGVRAGVYTLAVESETAPDRAQRRFTTICLCRDEIRCHDETVREPMIVPPSVPKKCSSPRGVPAAHPIRLGK
jgi:hypothetical protein